MEAAARNLVEYDPANAQWWILWANATRRASSLEAARLILVNALDQHDDEPVIHFNLACYECLLGNIEHAKVHLKACFSLDPGMRLMALEDEDLRPMWGAL